MTIIYNYQKHLWLNYKKWESYLWIKEWFPQRASQPSMQYVGLWHQGMLYMSAAMTKAWNTKVISVQEKVPYTAPKQTILNAIQAI